MSQKKVRLSDHDFAALKETFSRNFLKEDQLWLFGSRADLTKKGGDIDLYIETNAKTVGEAVKMQSHFISDLEQKIGEQKIDVVLNILKDQYKLPIYEVAKHEGVRVIMGKLTLDEMLKIADIHADRIKFATHEVSYLFPMTPAVAANIPKAQLGWIELLVSRFSQLKDFLGAILIDAFLEKTTENMKNLTMLDKIDKLERLEVIETAELWKEMRRARNHIEHEYPNNPELTAEKLNKIFDLAPKLLEFSDKIKMGILKTL